jgi:hypothetical protein
LRSHTLSLVILALALVCGSGAAQNSAPIESDMNSRATVRLEAHNSQTHFKIGDPVILDLVFTSRSLGYVVNTDTTSYLPVSDLVELAPEDGWVRSHVNFRGQSQHGNALANLGSSPIRVPILLNRTITFNEPGQYEVTLTTERLRISGDWSQTSPEACDPCRTTNALGIELSARDESEEAALVVSLSRDLEETNGSAGELSPQQKEELLHESEAAQERTAASTEASKKRSENLLRKINELASNQIAAIEKREDVRRETAVRLAYLAGDDAVRAKVHFIAEEPEADETPPIGHILRDGLPSSRNKQLQLTLLEAAWRDPHRVPTSLLHEALRQAKELMHKQWVTDEGMLWEETAEERQTALDQYQAEINEIIAPLPLRTESNRTETIDYLKKLAVPNQFNKHQTTNTTPN